MHRFSCLNIEPELNLEKSVGARKFAQVIDSPGTMKKTAHHQQGDFTFFHTTIQINYLHILFAFN